MDLEQQLQQIPKPLLAAGAIFIFILLTIFVLQPPHSVCDTEVGNLHQNQKGLLFPTKTGKVTMPAKIQSAIQSCRMGNSSGACYEYFGILRRVALDVKALSPDCRGNALSISIANYNRRLQCDPSDASRAMIKDDGTRYTQEELCDEALFPGNIVNVTFSSAPLKMVFEDAMTLMVTKAWGERPPEPGPQKFGWMQEYDIAVFCHIKDVYVRALGDLAYSQFRDKIFKTLPGEAPAVFPPPPGLDPNRKLAIKVSSYMPTEQIFERSLFSVRCDSFR